MAFRNLDLDFKLVRLDERHDGLPRPDDLSFLRRNGRDDPCRTCRQIRVADGIVGFCCLRQCLLVCRKRRVVIRLILVTHGSGNGVLIVQLRIAREVCLCKRELRTRGGDLCTAGIRFLHDIFWVDGHETIARRYARPDIHVARDDLPADLKGKVRLIAAAHDARIRARALALCILCLHRLDERCLFLGFLLAAACENRTAEEERRGKRQRLFSPRANGLCDAIRFI